MRKNWWYENLTPEDGRMMADVDRTMLLVMDETVNGFDDPALRERAAIRLLSPLLETLVVVNGGE